MQFFSLIFYQPIYNALIWLYDLCNDFGIAIIIITVLIKFVLIPLSRKQIESQKEMQDLQPKIKELQTKYKGDREKLSKETMTLYKEHKVNPAAGCLPLIIQMVIFITMYRVIVNLSSNNDIVIHAEKLYSFVTFPESINIFFLGFMDLTKPYAALAIITAAAQFYQLKMMQTKNVNSTNATKIKEKEEKSDPDFASIMQKQMLFIVPIMTLFIGLKFPSGLSLYWLSSTIFMIAQQWFITHKEKEIPSLS